MNQSSNIKEEPLDIKLENHSSSDDEAGNDNTRLDPGKFNDAHKVAPYACDICHKRFTQKSYLKIHMYTHTGQKPHECDICHIRFIQTGLLKVHKLKHHVGEYRNDRRKKDPNPPAPPTQTPAVVIVKSNDISIHDSSDDTDAVPPRFVPKKHECKVCHRLFTTGDLKKHMRTHTGEKPFKCPICNGSFAEKSNYTRHKRIHTRNTPQVCTICRKIFAQSCNLEEHMVNVHGRVNHTVDTSSTQSAPINRSYTERHCTEIAQDSETDTASDTEMVDEPVRVKKARVKEERITEHVDVKQQPFFIKVESKICEDGDDKSDIHTKCAIYIKDGCASKYLKEETLHVKQESDDES